MAKAIRMTEAQFDEFLAKKHKSEPTAFDAARKGSAVKPSPKAPQIVQKQPQRSKHGAVKVLEADGLKFDSKLEARCWRELEIRQSAGEIRNLSRQVAYSLFGPRGHHIGKYIADFEYEEKIQLNAWRWVTADAKSAHTRKLPGWNRTKTLMYACHSIVVLELP